MFNRFKGNQVSPFAEGGRESAPSAEQLASSTYRPTTQPTGVKGLLSQTDKPAIVSEQFTIRGDIDSEGTLHVEGNVIGTVRAHTIHISATGHIEGDVICASLNVKGGVHGSIACQELVMSATARIKGKVRYQFITVGPGAWLDAEMTLDG